MSNLAYKPKKQYEQQQQLNMQPKEKPKKASKGARITLGEKILAVFVFLIFGMLAIKIIATQATIYEMNKGIQDLQTTINKQKTVNDDLRVQVKELSNPERMLKKAEGLGLDLKENNVKVVEQK